MNGIDALEAVSKAFLRGAVHHTSDLQVSFRVADYLASPTS